MYVMSLTPAVYSDLSSFQVGMKLFNFPLMCMHQTLELKKFCYESLKKVSILELRES